MSQDVKMELPNLEEENEIKDSFDKMIDNIDSQNSHSDNYTPSAENFSCLKDLNLNNEGELAKSIESDLQLLADQKKKSKVGKPKKNDLIKSIVKIYKSKNEPLPYSENMFRKKTIPELEEMLGKLLDDSMNKIYDKHMNIEPEQTKPEQSNPEQTKPEQPNSEQPEQPNPEQSNPKQADYQEMGARQLFMFNKAIGELCQALGNRGLAYAEIDAEIDSLPNHIEERKEDLLEVYKQIYKENAQAISQYMTATNMVVLINADCVAKSVKMTKKK